MNNNAEQVKQLIGEENYQILLKHGYFPVDIIEFRKMFGKIFSVNKSVTH